MTNQLTVAAENTGLGGAKVKELMENFSEFFENATKLETMAMGIKVTDESQKGDMAQARELRLKLKQIRVDTDKKRKGLKEQSLREGKAIDGVSNIIKALIVPAEEHLERQEKFVENLEAERKLRTFENRTALLGKYVEDMSGYNLAEMTDKVFDKVLESSRVAHETQKVAERKAEEERVAKEKADAEEAAKLKEENARLKKEFDEREERSRQETAERLRINNENEAKQKKIDDEKEAKLQKERNAIEAEIQKERDRIAAEQKKIDDENARLEAEATAKEEAAKEELAKKGAEEQAAKMAPDKDKLLEYARRIRSVETALCASPAAAALVINFQKRLSEIATDLEIQVKRI